MQTSIIFPEMFFIQYGSGSSKETGSTSLHQNNVGHWSTLQVGCRYRSMSFEEIMKLENRSPSEYSHSWPTSRHQLLCFGFFWFCASFIIFLFRATQPFLSPISLHQRLKACSWTGSVYAAVEWDIWPELSVLRTKGLAQVSTGARLASHSNQYQQQGAGAALWLAMFIHPYSVHLSAEKKIHWATDIESKNS